MDEQPRDSFFKQLFRFIRRFFFWILVIVALIVLALVFEAGRWSVYSTHPDLSSAEQASEILQNVGKLIQLPAETPTMATINDAATAKKNQPFLTSAENGDVLIVFPQTAEALLYRPSTNKLIAVGPVDNGNNVPQVQAPTPSPEATTSNDKSGKH